jgi:adenylate cyclase
VSLVIALAAGVVCALAFMVLCLPGRLLYSLESHALDSRFHFRDSLPAPSDLAIIAIDEKSLRDPDLGRWEWDRRWHARLIDQIARDKPAAIGFDVIFSEPQRGGGGDDQALLAATARAGSVIYAAHVGQPGPAEPAGLDRLAIQPGLVSRQDRAPLLPALTPPLASLAAVAAGVGVIAGRPDEDSTVRRAFFLVAAGRRGRFFATLPLALAARASHWDPAQMRFNLAREAVLAPGRTIPLDETGCAAINYLGPAGTVPQYSFADVVKGKLPAGTFTDKVALVGLTAPGLGDYYPTPVGDMFGVEIQAQTVANLRQGLFLRPADLATGLALAILLGLLAAGLAVGLRPLVGLAGVVLVVVLYAMLGMAQFRAQVVWPVLPPVATALVTFAGLAVWRLSTEEAGRRRLREQFGRYAPPQVVQRLDAGEMHERSAGTLRPVTALFADVRGFTAWSAQTPPHEVVAVLNEYFEAMTELAFDLEGTVDNIVGDEIFITFNVLEDQPDHPERAAHLALNMVRALEQLNQRWQAAGIMAEPLRIGIGLHSEEALVGNLGSQIRTQYTCLGQGINLASRLQSLNKELGTTILTSAETAARLGDEFRLRDWGEQAIRGHPVPVHVYEIQSGERETWQVEREGSAAAALPGGGNDHE